MRRKSERLERHLQPVPGLRDRPGLPFGRVACAGGRLDPVALEQLRHQHLDLHIGKMQPQTHMRAPAEGNPRIFVPRLDLIGGEAQRIEGLRVVPIFLRMVGPVDIDPDQVVAVGAALQADMLVGNRSGDDMLLLDVNPLSLGIETMGGLVEKIIPRNATIPVARAQEFTTYKDGQTAMAIHVLQGERELVADNRSLARFELRGIPPMAAGAARILVTFQVDADGILSVSAKEQSTGTESSIQVKPSYGLEDEEITRMIKESIDYAQHDVAARQLREKQVEGEALLASVSNALAEDGDALLSAAERDQLKQEINTLMQALNSQEIDAIGVAIERLSQASGEFASRRMDVSIKRALAGQSLDQLDVDDR